ncbi:MAG: hypothetical protein ACHQQ3_14380, partial [Gemmatimonadales bacterium]
MPQSEPVDERPEADALYDSRYAQEASDKRWRRRHQAAATGRAACRRKSYHSPMPRPVVAETW